MKNAIRLSYNKEDVLRFQNIYKLNAFFQFRRSKIWKQHILKNLNFCISVFHPRKHFFGRIQRNVNVLDFDNNFKMFLKLYKSCIIHRLEQNRVQMSIGFRVQTHTKGENWQLNFFVNKRNTSRKSNPYFALSWFSIASPTTQLII